jgi:hypothetical protein
MPGCERRDGHCICRVLLTLRKQKSGKCHKNGKSEPISILPSGLDRIAIRPSLNGASWGAQNSGVVMGPGVIPVFSRRHDSATKRLPMGGVLRLIESAQVQTSLGDTRPNVAPVVAARGVGSTVAETIPTVPVVGNRRKRRGPERVRHWTPRHRDILERIPLGVQWSHQPVRHSFVPMGAQCRAVYAGFSSSVTAF